MTGGLVRKDTGTGAGFKKKNEALSSVNDPENAQDCVC